MPTTDRVLVEIVTAANMTGIKEAQAGFLGMSSALTAAIAGLGLAVVAGKSMIDITEKHQKAENDLAQAVAEVNAQFGKTTYGSAAAGEAAVKAHDALTRAQDSLTISSNAARLAQLAYTDAVRKHGITSEEAYKASFHLQDANIRLAASQKVLAQATEAESAAQDEMQPKTATAILDLATYRKEIDAFIDSNRAYISDQSEVIDGYATLIRAGVSYKETQLDMNRALDLAAIKHISLSEAVDLINKAEHGRLRGLIDLGITTGKYTDAQGNLINGTKDLGKVWDEVDPKLAKGRDTLTQTHQATNRLSNDWQDISKTVGPSLVEALDAILRAADWVFKKLKELGDNKDWGNAVSAVFGIWQDQITGVINSVKWLIDNLNRVANVFATPGGGAATRGRGFGPGRASGGPMAPGGVYTVGETGIETVFMGPEGGGYVVPSGGGGGGGGPSYYIPISIGTYVGNADQLSKMLAHELRLTGAFK